MSTHDTITLAQITDVHLPPALTWKPWIWNLKRCVGLLNWYRNRRDLHLAPVAALIAADCVAQNPDHIAVTGDVASLGLPGEFAVGLTWLETLGDIARVSLIPGNHDIYTKGCDVACLREWATYMRSDAWGRDFLGGADGFPYVRRVGNVALVALNSAVPTRLFVAAGRIGPRQMQATAEILDRLKAEGLIRVVLIHHPPLKQQAPARRALEDAKAFEKLLKEHGADIVLHGHNHRDTLFWTGAEGGARIPIVGLATGSTGREHRHEPLARYNLYKISGRGGDARIEIITRGLESAGGKIIELRRQVLAPDATLAASGSVMSVP
jgi:3',5'-cyclic AMP phosphodiesterase CpdA